MRNGIVIWASFLLLILVVLIYVGNEKDLPDASHVEFLTEVRDVIRDTKAPMTIQTGVMRGFKDYDVSLVWSSCGERDVLAMSVTDYPMPESYSSRLARKISVIYHLRFPNSDSFNFVIVDLRYHRIVYQDVFRWKGE